MIALTLALALNAQDASQSAVEPSVTRQQACAWANVEPERCDAWLEQGAWDALWLAEADQLDNFAVGRLLRDRALNCRNAQTIQQQLQMALERLDPDEFAELGVAMLWAGWIAERSCSVAP